MTKYVVVLGIELLDLVNESLTRGVLLLVNLMGDGVDFDNIKNGVIYGGWGRPRRRNHLAKI